LNHSSSVVQPRGKLLYRLHVTVEYQTLSSSLCVKCQGESRKPLYQYWNFCIYICNKKYSITQIIPSSSGPVVMLVDRSGLHQLSLQVRRVLMEQPSGTMSAGEFLRTFWNYFNQTLDLDKIQKQLAGVIQVPHSNVSTTI
jgi:hypothetical protein